MNNHFNLFMQTNNNTDAIIKPSASNEAFISLVESLRDIIRDNGHKHSSYICVRKAIVLPILDELYAKALSLKPVRNCDTCELYKRAYAEAIASATIDRLIRCADDADSPITKHEADSLAKIFAHDSNEV